MKEIEYRVQSTDDRVQSTDDKVQSTDCRVQMTEEVDGGADLVFHVSGFRCLSTLSL